jgi:TRAP-type uncharacterized transport system fused permease subunit
MLLLQNVILFDLAVLTVSAFLGVVALAAALEGWAFRMLRHWERLIIGVAALTAIHHDIKLSIASSIFLLGALVYFVKTGRNAY